MEAVKLETFFTPDTDWELNQYKVLGGLQILRNEFNKKKIYPALDDLIKLNTILEDIIKQRNNLNGQFPKEIRSFDLKNKKIIFDSIERSIPDVEFFFDFIKWSLPHIKEAIEEGIVLYEYVEKNIKISQVGILPLYKDEGYFIIPDNVEHKLQIHRFECSLYSTGNVPYRALKTKLVEFTQKDPLIKTPESIKRYLINQYRDLPNPATFLCDTDLDFPFIESLFPIAKRKLMEQVTA